MDQISAENLATLSSRHKAATLAIGIQIAVVLALVALSFKQFARIEMAPDEQTVMSMWMGILFLAGGSFMLRRIFNGGERLTTVTVLGGVQALTKRLLVNAVVTCVFGVACGAVGFVISQLTGNPGDMMRAAAVSLVVFFANFPRKSAWKAVVFKLQEL